MSYILKEIKDNIAIVTLNRPEKLNAFNSDMTEELCQTMYDLGNNKSIRCIVITGNNEKAFTVGGDIGEEITKDSISGYDFALLGKDCMLSIYDCAVPVIVAAKGYSLGAGLEIMIACDYTIVSEDAKIGIPTINLGTIPGWGSTQLLPRVVGIKKAKELLYTGKILNADEALHVGLVEKVVKKEILLSEAIELAKEIADKAPLAIRNMKLAINKGLETEFKSGLEIETGLFSMCYGSEDKKEAMSAFLEKRPHGEYKFK